MLNELFPIKYGLKANFNTIVDKKPNNVYIVTDSHEVFMTDSIGTPSLLNNVAFVTDLPDASQAEKGKIYIVESGNNIEFYTFNGTAFKAKATTSITKYVKTANYDKDTQVITVEYGDGTESKIDLVLGSVLKDVNYSSITKTVTFTLLNDSTTEIALSDLVDIYTANETKTAKITISDNEISVDVKISEEDGNAITVESDGLHVNLSAYMAIVPSAAENNFVVFDNAGGVKDVGFKVATVITDISTNKEIVTADLLASTLKNALKLGTF